MVQFSKDIDKKVSALDPKFREKITEMFETMHKSISLLYDAAIHDEKTGLYNNKFFETLLDMEIEKAKRKEQKLSLIMIDIDYFKKINDKYGHIKADELLFKLAEITKKIVRKSDVVARFGGEEFFILLPETSLEKARKLAIRLRKSVKEDSMLKKHNVNISGGVTQFKEGDTKKKLKERIDKALYKAKKQGRDRIISVR